MVSQKRSQRVTRQPTRLAGPDVTTRQAQRGISAFGGRKKMVDREGVAPPDTGIFSPGVESMRPHLVGGVAGWFSSAFGTYPKVDDVPRL